MKNPTVSEDPSDGQKSTFSIKLFDNLSNEDLNLIIDLASEICQIDVSSAILIDADGQIFRSASSTICENTSEHNLNAESHIGLEHLYHQSVITPDLCFQNDLSTGQLSVSSFVANVPLTLQDGTVLGTFCVSGTEAKEMSPHQKAALKSLAQLIVSLYESRKTSKEIDAIGKQMNLNRQQAEEVLYAVAHDLKSPLDTICGLLELLQFEIKTTQSIDVQAYVNYAIKSAIKMTWVINDILSFTNFENVENQEDTDLNELINNIIELNLPQIKAEQIQIEYNNLPILKTSKALLCIVLRNLIGNALKYKSERRILRIKISAEDRVNFWLIRVEDNGIGIHKSNVEKIFIAFYRENLKYGEGLGLGLATCKKIINTLGGDIWLDSELGKGSSFQFSIPK